MSRSSAKGVIGALKASYSHVIGIELDDKIATTLAKFAPDVVFPILHGPPGEDGTLQGFLEILGYAYVGSGVHSSSAAMDKILAKQIFREADLPLARQLVILKGDNIASAVKEILATLGTGVVVKPATQGSALGVTLVDNENQLHSAIETAFELGDKLLVEERIYGKEITVGVLDTPEGPMALPVIDIVTKGDAFYDFDHRYTEGLSEHVCPAELSLEQTKRLQQIAVDAHVSLGCRDMSRADFVVPSDDKEILLEVNTLPGMTPTSLYPDAAAVYGMNFELLVSYLAERAMNR